MRLRPTILAFALLALLLSSCATSRAKRLVHTACTLETAEADQRFLSRADPSMSFHALTNSDIQNLLGTDLPPLDDGALLVLVENVDSRISYDPSVELSGPAVWRDYRLDARDIAHRALGVREPVRPVQSVSVPETPSLYGLARVLSLGLFPASKRKPSSRTLRMSDEAYALRMAQFHVAEAMFTTRTEMRDARRLTGALEQRCRDLALNCRYLLVRPERGIGEPERVVITALFRGSRGNKHCTHAIRREVALPEGETLAERFNAALSGRRFAELSPVPKRPVEDLMVSAADEVVSALYFSIIEAAREHSRHQAEPPTP